MGDLALCGHDPKPLAYCRECVRNPANTPPGDRQSWMLPRYGADGCDHYVPVERDDRWCWLCNDPASCEMCKRDAPGQLELL